MLQQLQEAGITPQDILIFGGAIVLALVLVILAFACRRQPVEAAPEARDPDGARRPTPSAARFPPST